MPVLMSFCQSDTVRVCLLTVTKWNFHLEMNTRTDMALGMHKRGSFYDIVTVEDCRIVDGDFRAILMATLAYFREREIFFYHRLRHTGYLRHLLVRKAVKTGEILVDLITTTQDWRNVQEQEPDERAKIEAALLEKQGRCPHAGTVNEEKKSSF